MPGMPPCTRIGPRPVAKRSTSAVGSPEVLVGCERSVAEKGMAENEFRSTSVGGRLFLWYTALMEIKMVALAYPHIVKENGQPARLEQHPRIRVAMIVMDYLAYGWSPDEVRRQHPHLTLAEVHAAMGYYYDHQEEIDGEITTELEEVDRALQKPKRSPVWVKLKTQGLIK